MLLTQRCVILLTIILWTISAAMAQSVNMPTPKTKDLKLKLDAFGWKKVLFIAGENVDANFALACENLIKVDALPSCGANVYDILNHDTLVLTKDAVDALTKRFVK